MRQALAGPLLPSRQEGTLPHRCGPSCSANPTPGGRPHRSVSPDPFFIMTKAELEAETVEVGEAVGPRAGSIASGWAPPGHGWLSWARLGVVVCAAGRCGFREVPASAGSQESLPLVPILLHAGEDSGQGDGHQGARCSTLERALAISSVSESPAGGLLALLEKSAVSPLRGAAAVCEGAAARYRGEQRRDGRAIRS